MLYRFSKRKRWVTYQKTKKSETKVGYLSLFLHPFHRQPMLKFDIFFLEYLLGDPHIFFQILNENINRALISKFESFLDRKKLPYTVLNITPGINVFNNSSPSSPILCQITRFLPSKIPK